MVQVSNDHSANLGKWEEKSDNDVQHSSAVQNDAYDLGSPGMLTDCLPVFYEVNDSTEDNGDVVD